MSEEQARALAADVERRLGWLTEIWEGANGQWYVLARRDTDPLTYFVLRNQHDWEQLHKLLSGVV
jgi:hypothetical protein